MTPVLQGLNPFFMFQFYTVILWTLQFYWKFALIIAVTTVITVTYSVWETRRVSINILASHLHGTVLFIKNAKI